MKWLRYSAVALLAFVIGIVISPIHFFVRGWGCGKVLDGGGGFSVTSYRSSYFVNVTFAHEGYVSADKANQVFADRLKELAKIVDVTPKTDAGGKIVGRRAAGTFVDEKGITQASVFWTDGKMLHSIYSTSWLHATALEKASTHWK